MTTIRNKQNPPPATNAKPAPATPPSGAPQQPTVSRDSLQVSKPVENDALKVLNEAAQLPPMPSDAAGQRAWLADGFTRQLKMSAAEIQLRDAWRAGKASGNDLSVARSRIWAVESQLSKAPGYEAAKKEFFAGVIGQANGLLDGLAKYPAAPADKAGKAKWLTEAKAHLAKAKEAERIMKDCWFEHKVVSFDELGVASKKLWDFESQVRRVDYELNPPPPRKPGQSPSNGGPGRPLFELTQEAQKGLDSKNPVGQTVGAVVMPIALTIDLIDMLTRPLQWLDANQKKK